MFPRLTVAPPLHIESRGRYRLSIAREKCVLTKNKYYLSYGLLFKFKMSRVMGKPTFCICENKDADQLHGNSEADQRLCFRYTDSTIPLLSKSEISSL